MTFSEPKRIFTLTMHYDFTKQLISTVEWWHRKMEFLGCYWVILAIRQNQRYRVIISEISVRYQINFVCQLFHGQCFHARKYMNTYLNSIWPVIVITFEDNVISS